MSSTHCFSGDPLRWQRGRPRRVSPSIDPSTWRGSIGCCRRRTIVWRLTKSWLMVCPLPHTVAFRRSSSCRRSPGQRSRWLPWILWIYRPRRTRMPARSACPPSFGRLTNMRERLPWDDRTKTNLPDIASSPGAWCGSASGIHRGRQRLVRTMSLLNSPRAMDNSNIASKAAASPSTAPLQKMSWSPT